MKDAERFILLVGGGQTTVIGPTNELLFGEILAHLFAGAPVEWAIFADGVHASAVGEAQIADRFGGAFGWARDPKRTVREFCCRLRHADELFVTGDPGIAGKVFSEAKRVGDELRLAVGIGETGVVLGAAVRGDTTVACIGSPERPARCAFCVGWCV